MSGSLKELGTSSSFSSDAIPNVLETDNLTATLPPVDGGLQAWTFVFAAFILETFAWGWSFTYGVFQAYYTLNPSSPVPHASSASIVIIGTSALGLQYMAFIVTGALMQLIPQWTKFMMWACVALCSLSLIISSFVTEVWQLILLQGILFGMGAGLLYGPTMTWINEWFQKRRGLAGAIIFAGSFVGGAVFPPVIGLLLEHVGFSWTLRISGIVFAVACAPAVWATNPRIPITSARTDRVVHFDRRILQHPNFYFVALAIGVQAVGYFPVSIYLPTYVSALGFPSITGTLVLSVFNVAAVFGQILFGELSDRMPYTWVMTLSGVTSALAAFLLWGFDHSLGMTFAFVIVFGGLSGGFTSMWSAGCTEVAGQNSPSNPMVFGAFGVSKGVATIIGPLVAGTLYQSSAQGVSVDTTGYGSYGFGKVTVFVGSLMLATAALSIGSAIISMVMRRQARGSMPSSESSQWAT